MLLRSKAASVVMFTADRFVKAPRQ